MCDADDASGNLVRLEDEIVVNPSDDDAARANIIATSRDAGTWLLVAILIVSNIDEWS